MNALNVLFIYSRYLETVLLPGPEKPLILS
jgi:hypothetical protein